MSTILVNTLTGTSTAGSIAVTGEGNSTTTNLQSGLAKMFVRANGSAVTTSTDSFNTSSGTDLGTGNYDHTFTNNMSATVYSVTTSGQSGNARIASYSNLRTTAVEVDMHDDGGSNADTGYRIQVFGDLA